MQPMQPFETSDALTRPARMSGGPAAQRGPAGLTPSQVRRLAALRARIRRGAYADDGAGTVLGSRLADRRLEFARWLVQTGRLHEGAA
jgi:hypothetical protein